MILRSRDKGGQYAMSLYAFLVSGSACTCVLEKTPPKPFLSGGELSLESNQNFNRR